MKWAILVLLFVGLVTARPSCGYFPHHDFFWESNYAAPTRPPDTLLDNCGQIGVDSSICSELTNPNLTIKEKKQLVLDGLVENSSAPDFGAAKEWNSNLQFTKYAPDGVPYHDSTNIRDAWLKIVSINPSLYAGNTLMVNGSGEVKAAFNFSFVVRKESFPQDCATQYEICGYNYALNKQLGNNNASATLTINTQYLIHHSSLVTYCDSTPDGDICYTVCEYSYSDNVRDSLTLNDKIAVKQYIPNYTAFTFIEWSNNNLIDGWLVFNASDRFNSAKFTIDNLYVLFRNSSYKLSANFTPYNAITPEVINSPKDFGFYGLSILEYDRNGTWAKIHFLAPADKLNCSFDFYGHFSHVSEADFCKLSEDEPIINLTLLNRTNETIAVKLSFYDNISSATFIGKQIELSYDNQSINLTTDLNGEAEYTFAYSSYSNLISAEFKTDFQTKSVKTQFIIPPDFPISILTAFYTVSIILALYLFYEFSKRWNNEK